VTPEQAAHETASIVVSVPARFMTDPATYARGAELGFDGFDFYVAGRGGALGDVTASVVAAAFWVFAEDLVRAAWERTETVLPRRDAAVEWLACGHRYAAAHFADGPDYERTATLLGPIVASAAVAGAPMFAAVRELPEPTDARALVIHRLNALRELRGALHGAAILTVGLRPVEAIVARAPDSVGAFGWPAPFPPPEPLRERWSLAEARTDRMFGRHLAVLDEGERVEFVEALRAVAAAVD
jgi:hypothetical protein